MFKRLQNYFIGKYLSETEDVFERARVIMFYRFGLSFVVFFTLPVFADYNMGLHKALIKHSIDYASIVGMVFFLRLAIKLEKVINYFFCIIFVSSMTAMMMLNPTELDPVASLWAVFFLVLSALMQRGWQRMLYCFVLGWIPVLYVLINKELKGALTIEALVENNIPGDPPLFLLFLPMVLLVIAIWSHTSTIQKARETMTAQKKLIEERNNEIIDSIRYAKRIQKSLMPQDKYMERKIKELKKN